MNRNDIIRMAREAGIDALTKVGAAELERFAALVVDSAQQAEVTPPGYVLVPVEPTEEMEMVWDDAHGDGAPFHAMYAALIAAAQGEKP